jgi:hypothetical protein
MGKKSDRRTQRIADAIARNGGVDRKAVKDSIEPPTRRRFDYDPFLMADPGLAILAMMALMSARPKKKLTEDPTPESPSEPEKE